MKQAADDEGRALSEGAISMAAAFEGTEAIAQARDRAGAFLRDLRVEHGVPVPERVVNVVQLVVSELVTNSRKYAPGPSLLTLEARDDSVAVSVWDTEPHLPVVRGADPVRVGQHGLEIVRAVCESLVVRREPVGKRVTATIGLTERPPAETPDDRP
jgi:signal transduction histidine kinase